MNPRLMVICLGGLAGTGAMVCCDLNEGVDELDVAAEGEEAEAVAAESDNAAGDPNGAALH